MSFCVIKFYPKISRAAGNRQSLSFFVPGKSKLTEREKIIMPKHVKGSCEMGSVQDDVASVVNPGYYTFIFYHLVYGSSPWQHVNSALTPESNKIACIDVCPLHASCVGITHTLYLMDPKKVKSRFQQLGVFSSAVSNLTIRRCVQFLCRVDVQQLGPRSKISVHCFLTVTYKTLKIDVL